MRTPEDKAATVAQIAQQVGYRKHHRIEHTRHAENRLLAAVSELLGYRVVVLNHYTAAVGPESGED